MIKTKQQGSVIIEVLVASLIFAATVVALVEFQTNLLRERVYINQQSEALTYTQDKMQYFRNYTALTNATAGIAYTNITNGSTNITATTANYTLTWTAVSNAATTNTPEYKNVTITATWTDPTGTSRSASINSFIGKIDPQATGKVSDSLP